MDEVRQEVVRGFKMIEARKQATAAAEQLAKEPARREKPLSELFAGREGFEVVNTGPFTWMTIGAVPSIPIQPTPAVGCAWRGIARTRFHGAVFDSTPDQIPVR